MIVVSVGECVRPGKRAPPRPALQNKAERMEGKREGEGKGEGCKKVETELVPSSPKIHISPEMG